MTRNFTKEVVQMINKRMKMFINNNQRNASSNNIDILSFLYQIGEDLIRANTHHEGGCREQSILKAAGKSALVQTLWRTVGNFHQNS